MGETRKAHRILAKKIFVNNHFKDGEKVKG
jgi:hypothetical protein